MKENKVKNFKQKNIAISTKLGLTAIAFAATSGIAHAAPPSFDVDLVDTYSTTMNNEKFKDLADAQLKNEIRLSKLYYLMKAQGDGTMTDAEYWSMVDQLLKPSDVVAADGTGSYSLYSQTSDIGAQVSASPYVLIGTGSKIRIVAGSGVDTDGDGQFDQYTPDFEDVKSGTIGGKTYDYAGGYSSGMVSFGDNTATADDGSIGTYRTLTNMAAGRVTAESTDGINGSQLYATNLAVDDLADTVGKGTNFIGGDAGSIAKNIQLGDTLAMSGDTNIGVISDANGMHITLKPNVTADSFTAGGVSISKTGVNAGNFKVVNVADGEVSVDSKDAVNGSQLYQTELNLTTIINQGLNFVDNQGTRVNRKFGEDLGLINTDGNISTKFIGNNLSIDLGKDIKVDSVNVGDTVVINNGGINAGDTKITNVADGEVSSTSKDAVNGSQLNEVKQALDGGLTFVTDDGEVTKKLGDTVGIHNNDGNIGIGVDVNGNIIVDLNKDIKVDTVTANTVKTDNLHVGDVVINQDGINAGNTKITNVSDGEISADSKDAVNGSQLYEVKNHVDTVLGQGIGFADKDGNTTNTKLGETFTITNTDNNITTKVSDGQISIDLADNVKVNESINVGGVVNISKDGINAGDTKITNVADGTISADSKDAVNGSQLHETNTNVTNLTDKVNKGMNFADKDGNTTNMQLGDTFKITNTDNNLTTKVSDGQVSIDLASEIKVDKVTTGNVSISKDGVDAGGKKVIHVADGDISQNSTDAVNGSQLHQTNQNIKNLGDKVEENRKVSSQGIASVAAMDIEYPEQKPGQWATGVGVGHYDGEQAVAVGVNFLSENGKYKVGASYGQALGSGSKPAAKASLGWVW